MFDCINVIVSFDFGQRLLGVRDGAGTWLCHGPWPGRNIKFHVPWSFTGVPGLVGSVSRFHITYTNIFNILMYLHLILVFMWCRISRFNAKFRRIEFTLDREKKSSYLHYERYPVPGPWLHDRRTTLLATSDLTTQYGWKKHMCYIIVRVSSTSTSPPTRTRLGGGGGPHTPFFNQQEKKE